MSSTMFGVEIRDQLPHYTESLPRPTIGPSQVLIEVMAASVNPVDWKISRGDLSPIVPAARIPGFDVAGRIVAVGENVTRFKVGDEVWADTSPISGTYAQYCVCNESNVDFKPPSLDWIHAAAIPLAGLTAYQALVHTCMLKPGDNVLVLGAGGGVGHLAVQIAKACGAEVWAVCSESKKDFVKKLGASHVITRGKDFILEIGTTRMDIVFDAAGVEKDRDRAFNVLKPHTGHLITTQPLDPASSPSWLDTIGATLKVAWDKTVSALWRDVHYHVFLVDASKGGKDLPKLRELVEQKVLNVAIDSVFPLQQVQQAWIHSQSMSARGKIVLRVNPSAA